MKNDYTHLCICLDRSGSMMNIHGATLSGLHRLIRDQQNAPGHCSLTLVQFDHFNNRVNIETPIENQAIKTVSTLFEYLPRGGTPLYDAIAESIGHTGRFLKSLPESERPAKVIFAIITDGLENSSVTHTKEAVFNMVKHQTDVYKWEFLFIGANQDAYANGAGIGIPLSHSVNYTANDQGTHDLYASVSSNVRRARAEAFAGNIGCSCAGFSDEDREKQAAAK